MCFGYVVGQNIAWKKLYCDCGIAQNPYRYPLPSIYPAKPEHIRSQDLEDFGIILIPPKLKSQGKIVVVVLYQLTQCLETCGSQPLVF